MRWKASGNCQRTGPSLGEAAIGSIRSQIGGRPPHVCQPLDVREEAARLHGEDEACGVDSTQLATVEWVGQAVEGVADLDGVEERRVVPSEPAALCQPLRVDALPASPRSSTPSSRCADRLHAASMCRLYACAGTGRRAPRETSGRRAQEEDERDDQVRRPGDHFEQRRVPVVAEQRGQELANVESSFTTPFVSHRCSTVIGRRLGLELVDPVGEQARGEDDQEDPGHRGRTGAGSTAETPCRERCRWRSR